MFLNIFFLIFMFIFIKKNVFSYSFIYELQLFIKLTHTIHKNVDSEVKKLIKIYSNIAPDRRGNVNGMNWCEGIPGPKRWSSEENPTSATLVPGLSSSSPHSAPLPP